MKLWPAALVLPERTLSGAGIINQILAECAAFGRRGLLVHGRSLARHGTVASILSAAPAGLQVTAWQHTGGEPTLEDLAELLQAARQQRAEWVAGVGGGSVLDLAKACAGLFHAAQPLAAYHAGAALEKRGLPFIAAPTTAGTGSEATLNSVLTDTDLRIKKSMRDPQFIARLVLLDPELLRHCPPAIIAQAGMDALTQALEVFTSRHATWLSDVVALKGVELIAANLEAVYRGASAEEALGLLAGSYLSGVGLSMARLGVVHGLAHPLGLRYQAAHGLVCGICLPHAIALNRAAMGAKYAALSQAVGADLLTWTQGLGERLALRSPFKGRSLNDKEAIIQETLASGSTQANPQPITAADVEWLLEQLF